MHGIVINYIYLRYNKLQYSAKIRFRIQTTFMLEITNCMII
jgi:hypothetical protein